MRKCVNDLIEVAGPDLQYAILGQISFINNHDS